jgi:hypothetical protein
MKHHVIFSIILAAMSFSDVAAQTATPAITKLQAVSVSMSAERIGTQNAIRVVKDDSVKAFDEPTFAKLKDVKFKNGTIEARVLSRLLKDAPESARGFIGIAFRIDDLNSKFECLYIRPTNGRVEIQLRRNRATQYFSYPDFKFDRLRKEAPGEYESYADIGLDEWIDLRIEVRGTRARLIVNDLKHGPDLSGAVGLWVEFGTEGYFADLRIKHH